ncbi:MAG TPA: heavy-metal-associated domain-containing protein [Saprospiraceae bacterium]|nr:heavy-metal-associated domain-containing protein [Saprospiraceae bacterium]
MKKILFAFVLSLGLVASYAQSNTTNSKTEVAQTNAKTVKIKVDGMSCQQMCANGIDKKLKSTDGIQESKTTLESGMSIVTFDASKISEKEIVSIIEKRNYKAKVVKK